MRNCQLLKKELVLIFILFYISSRTFFQSGPSTRRAKLDFAQDKFCFAEFGSGGGTRTHDLQVMGLPSCQLLYPASFLIIFCLSTYYQDIFGPDLI
jgi:hypothetical protein